jgi:hypothetical protein
VATKGKTTCVSTTVANSHPNTNRARVCKEPLRYSVNTIRYTNIIIAKILEFKPVKCFVDGCGIGGAVIDRLNQLGYGYVVMEANAAKSPDDKERYVNKRAEMWDRMREWLSTGCINDDIRLELTAPLDLTHSESRQGKILLESKEDMLKSDLASLPFLNTIVDLSLPARATSTPIIKGSRLSNERGEPRRFCGSSLSHWNAFVF